MISGVAPTTGVAPGTTGTAPGISVAVWLLECYKRWLSPLLPRGCRFAPTCSEYARLAFLEHGFWRGIWCAFWRLMRCHPLAPGGLDLP